MKNILWPTSPFSFHPIALHPSQHVGKVLEVLCLLHPVLLLVSPELIQVIFSLRYCTETTFGKVTNDFK